MKINRFSLNKQMVWLYVAGPSLGVIALFTLGYITWRVRKKIKNCCKDSSKIEESNENSSAHSVIVEVQDEKRNKVPQPKVLENHGNTCYMNAILQTLAWCPNLEHELEKLELKENCEMTNSILRLLKYTHSKEPMQFDPKEVLQAARKRNNRFAGNNQQDSFEMYNTIIETMTEEIKELKEKKENGGIYTPHEEQMKETYKQSTKGVRLFLGTLVTVFDYSSCKHVYSAFQECSHITVQIKDIIENDKDTTQVKINRIALETMGKIDTEATNLEKGIINGQMKTKQIDKQMMPCRICELSGLDGVCYKKMMILEPPSILVLHIDRREEIQGEFTKSNYIVTYPERLNIEPFCSILLKETEVDQQLSYNLFGVVAHSGNLNSGHYVAYIKTVQDSANDWYKQMQNQWTFDVQEKYKDKVERKLETLKQIQKSVHVNSTENKNSDKRYTNSFTTPEMEIQDGTKWYCIDDNKVEGCKKEEAIDNKNAYLLMYVKK